MMNLVFIAKQEEQPEGCPECVDFFSFYSTNIPIYPYILNDLLCWLELRLLTFATLNDFLCEFRLSAVLP